MKWIHYAIYSSDWPNGTTEKLTLPRNTEIFDQINTALLEFRREFRIKPKAILLSPKTFLQYRFEFGQLPRVECVYQDGFFFDDVEILCGTSTLPILFILPEELIPHIAHRFETAERYET